MCPAALSALPTRVTRLTSGSFPKHTKAAEKEGKSAVKQRKAATAFVGCTLLAYRRACCVRACEAYPTPSVLVGRSALHIRRPSVHLAAVPSRRGMDKLESPRVPLFAALLRPDTQHHTTDTCTHAPTPPSSRTSRDSENGLTRESSSKIELSPTVYCK